VKYYLILASKNSQNQEIKMVALSNILISAISLHLTGMRQKIFSAKTLKFQQKAVSIIEETRIKKEIKVMMLLN
jgi:hypothetical protein